MSQSRASNYKSMNTREATMSQSRESNYKSMNTREATMSQSRASNFAKLLPFVQNEVGGAYF